MTHELLALERTPDIVSFSKLMRSLYRMKWFILLSVTLFAVGSAYYAINKPNVYTAKGIFIPADSSTGGGLSKIAGQFGGLASMAGISLGGDKGDNNAIALELLKSRSFLQAFIEKRNILPELLALKGWDQDTETLIYDETIFNVSTHTWVRIAPVRRKQIPTPWEGYYQLRGMFDVEYISKKGMINITLTSMSPQLSTKWLSWLIEDLNSYWRLQEQKLATDSINYIQDQIAKTNNSEMLSIFYDIIAEQTQKKLLTEVRKEYLFKTLAPIVTPEEKSAPSRALICVVGTSFGGLISIILSLIYCAVRPKE